MAKQTGFHENTLKLGAEYIEMNGYDIPQSYKNISVEEQYKNVRKNAGIIDLSYLPKIEILGPDAETLCQSVFTRDIKRMGDKSVLYTAVLNETGGMLDDGTLFRVLVNNFRFVCGFGETIDHIRAVAKSMNLKVQIKDVTDLYANFAVQGPNSLKVLDGNFAVSIINMGVDKLSPFRLAS